MRQALLLTLFWFCSVAIVSGQVDFRRNWDFFQSRQIEYQTWLATNTLGNFFRVESLETTPKRLVLVVASTFTGEYACDSLRSAWNTLREQCYRDTRQQLHALMLEKFCFQMDLPLDSAGILIYCPNSTYQVRIFGERSEGRQTARFEEVEDKSMGSGVIPIPVGQLKEVYLGGGTRFGEKSGADIRKVRRAVGDYFYRHYQPKGTKWFWKAQIDTSSSYYNEFTYHITYISGQVLKGRNFFEYHRVNVKIEQVNEVLNISWNFSAKYGGGLVYPPHTNSNDYRDLETSAFKGAFEDYQRDLFKKLEEQLKQL